MRHTLWTQVRVRWFLVALAVVVVSGTFLPRQLKPFTDLINTTIVILVIMFLMSLTLDFSHIAKAARRPGTVGLGVLLGYAVPPLLAFAATHSPLISGNDFRLGTLIVTAVPCTLASATIWTRIGGGNDALALLVTVASNSSGFLVTPLLLSLTAGSSVRMDTRDMMLKLFEVIVLPVVAGQVVRSAPGVAPRADRVKGWVAVVNRLLILSVILMGVSKASLKLTESSTAIPYLQLAVLLATVSAIHTVSAAVCWYASRALRLTRNDAIALVFTGAQKTLPTGLYIAATFFPRYPLASIPVLLFHASQLTIDTWVADLFVHRAKRRGTLLQSPDVDPLG